MAHDHHHHDDAGYFTEQLCTVGISALLGLVSVLLYVNGQLNLMLSRKLEWTVLAGGITLLALAAIRGTMIWVAAGQNRVAGHTHDHDHVHVHGHDHDHAHGHHHHDHDHAHAEAHDHEHGDHHHHHHHDHEHAHAGHDHGHDHDHSFSAMRYVVLLLPVVLFFLGLPNEGFQIVAAEDVGDIHGATGPVKANSAPPVALGFLELTGAAYSPDRRALYEGKNVRLKGAFQSARSDRYFSLVRMKITCCAADAIPLPVVIMIDPASKEHINPASYQGKWVEVTGQVQFRTRTRNGQEDWTTVVLIRPDKDHPLKELIALVPPDNSPLQ